MSQQYTPAPRAQQAPVSVENQIVQMRGEFARAIGGATPQEQQKRAERFARVCVTAIRKSPQLQRCNPASILGAMMECAQLDLEPNTPSGLAYLIPYGRDCTLQIGYRGLLQLMYRSGTVASFNADVVYRGEVEAGLFSYTSGIHPNIEHHIDLLDGSARTGNPQDIVAAYACAVLKSGEPVIRLVTRKDIDQARAQGGKNSPAWRDHFAAMAIKTAIKRLAQWLPSTKMDEAFAAEEKFLPQEQTPAEPVQAGISIEAMNAMMQASVAEVPQEAPAVEAPAPQPEPVQPAPGPAPAPKEERPQAFRPAQEVQTAPAGVSIDTRWDDFWADRNGDGEPEARDACFQMVQAGEASDMQDAKARWLAQAQSMDAEQF